MIKMISTPAKYHWFLCTVVALLFSPLLSKAQWVIPTIGGTLPNSGVDLGNDCFELSTGLNQRAAIWNSTMMDLSQPFDITLRVWHDVHGADAIAFVLQNSGTNAHGAGGNGNGYATAVPASAYPGITPSVAVELDLFFNNVVGVNDISADHVAIHTNGDLSAAAAGPSSAIPNGNPIPDNQCFPLRITWAPAPVNTMEVYWNNQLRITWTNDIVANFFGNNPAVFWGITGSCGSVAMSQRVCVGADFAQAGPDRTICLGDTVHMNASGGATYAWGIGFPFLSSQNIPNPVFSSSSAQVRPCPLLVTDILGCTDRDTAIITVLASPTVSVDPIPGVCAGDSAQVSASASGGASPLSFLWNTGATTSGFMAAPLISTTYQVTVTDANGCADTSSGVFAVFPLETLDILEPDTALCVGAAIPSVNVITSGGINQFSWTPTTGVPSPSSPNTALIPTVSTTYFLTGTNTTSGCSATDSIHIDVFDLSVSHFTDTIVCLGDVLQFDIQPTLGSGDYLVVWTTIGGDALSADSIPNPFITANNNGTYVANILDNVSGCTAVVSIDVEVIRVDVFATPGSILINPGQRVQLNATGALFYSWLPDTMLSCNTCPDPVALVTTTTTYTVTGTDINGCTNTATVTIVGDSLVVPNVFTPNGDGINDELLLNYYGTYLYEISVFDRWGRQMFQTTDKNVMWDGRNKQGKDVPEGAYFLAVRIIGDDAIPAKDKQRVFTITLMR